MYPADVIAMEGSHDSQAHPRGHWVNAKELETWRAADVAVDCCQHHFIRCLKGAGARTCMRVWGNVM
jgi:hypothetical protein